MLIDLDKGSIDNFIDRLKAKLISRHRDLIIDSSESHRNDDALMHSVKLSKNNKSLGTIYVIGFYGSLESVTGIKKDTPDAERIELSRRYIKTSKIHDIFTMALDNS